MKKQIQVSIIIAAIAVGLAVIGFQQMNSDNLAVSASSLLEIEPENVLLVDIRDSSSYMDSHIPGSAVDYLEGTTLEKRVNTINNRIPDVASTSKIVLIGDDDSAYPVAQKMNDAGLDAYYLEGGIKSWKGDFSSKNTDTIISANDLYTQLENNAELYLLDVREPEELQVTMISESVNIPLADLFVEELSEIPTDKPVVVICGSGNRATIATYELAKYGIDFQVLEGGIKAWDTYLEENQLEPF